MEKINVIKSVGATAAVLAFENGTTKSEKMNSQMLVDNALGILTGKITVETLCEAAGHIVYAAELLQNKED